MGEKGLERKEEGERQLDGGGWVGCIGEDASPTSTVVHDPSVSWASILPVLLQRGRRTPHTTYGTCSFLHSFFLSRDTAHDALYLMRHVGSVVIAKTCLKH